MSIGVSVPPSLNSDSDPIGVGTTPIVPEVPAETTVPTASTAPSTVAPTVGALSFMNLYENPSQLSQKGKEFLDIIKQRCAESTRPVLTFEKFAVPLKADCVAIADSNHNVILLILAETYSGTDKLPVSDIVEDARTIISAKDAAAHVKQEKVIDPTMYDKAETMAMTIKNDFLTMAFSIEVANQDAAHNWQQEDFSMKFFANHMTVVDTNLDAVRAYIAKYSPHTVPARADYGILIKTVDRRTRDMNGQFAEPVPIAAVTGYTKIQLVDNGGMAYMPTNGTIPQYVKYGVTSIVTDIVTPYSNPAILGLIIPLAQHYFVDQQMWKMPYMTLKEGCPNIGNLFKGPDGKPIFADSIDAIENIFFNNFDPSGCRFAIDVTQGRSRLLAMDYLTNDIDRITVVRRMLQFMALDDATNAVLEGRLNDIASKGVSADVLTNFNGIYSNNGTFEDTRCVDYLTMINRMKGNPDASVQGLLRQMRNPDEFFAGIRAYYPENCQMLYRTNTVIFDKVLVSLIMEAFNESNRRYRVFDYNTIRSGTNLFISNAGWYERNRNQQYGSFSPLSNGGQRNSGSATYGPLI